MPSRCWRAAIVLVALMAVVPAGTASGSARPARGKLVVHVRRRRAVARWHGPQLPGGRRAHHGERSRRDPKAASRPPRGGQRRCCVPAATRFRSPRAPRTRRSPRPPSSEQVRPRRCFSPPFATSADGSTDLPPAPPASRACGGIVSLKDVVPHRVPNPSVVEFPAREPPNLEGSKLYPRRVSVAGR